jgi:hypothetical protein
MYKDLLHHPTVTGNSVYLLHVDVAVREDSLDLSKGLMRVSRNGKVKDDCHGSEEKQSYRFGMEL